MQQQGRLLEAAEELRRLLLTEPRNAQALHLLGIILGQMRRPEEAAELIAAAAGLQPSDPAVHANLGNALRELGRNAEALASYDRAISLKPEMAAAHRGRGTVLLALGEAQEALASLTRVVQLSPNDAEAYNGLGVALERLGRSREALDYFGRALTLHPNHVEAYHNRGIVEMSLGRYPEALASLERALAFAPRHPAILANRGNVLRALGRPADAVESYERSLSLAPDDFRTLFHHGVALALLERYEEALNSFDRAAAIDGQAAQVHNNRGVVLVHLARHEEALLAFARAVACSPDHPEAYTNTANTLKGLGRFAEALQNFDRALETAPDHAPSLWGKSLLKLTLGEFAQGWPLYESRLRLPELRPRQRDIMLPRWVGSSPIAGKSILIHAEQGLGDALQFSRYIPLLEARGAQVFFEVPVELSKLLRSLPMHGTLLADGEPSPPVDYHCPLLSLPLAFGTQADTIPAVVPYLSAEAAAVSQWRARLGALSGVKVGLNWQGHAGAERQAWIRGRSFALACMRPLAQVPGLSLVSLQKGPAAGQREEVEFARTLAQLTDPLDTGPDAMMEAAALICALDLVITSDTSVAHLAGALGVPVWIVLQTVPDWRWLLDRHDSPWYPNARLFRQRKVGDWAEVFERVAEELEARVHQDARSQR